MIAPVARDDGPVCLFTASALAPATHSVEHASRVTPSLDWWYVPLPHIPWRFHVPVRDHRRSRSRLTRRAPRRRRRAARYEGRSVQRRRGAEPPATRDLRALQE